MDRQAELALIDEIGDLLARGTTSMTPDVMHISPEGLVDRDLALAERDILFRRFPLVVGPSASIPEPGDFVTQQLAGLPLLVVRGSDGVVRVFLNLCRHRGNQLCSDGSGNKRVFSCPYHAWTFTREGACRAMVDREGFRGLDRDDYGLISYPCEERHGFIWMVPASEKPIDIAGYLGPELDADLAGYIGHTRHVFRYCRTSHSFNWKLGVNTFQELFHLAFLHKKTLGKAFISNLTAFRSYAPHQRLTVVRSTFPEMLTLPERARTLFPHCSLVYVLFPNVVLTWQLDHLELWRFAPDRDDPGKCTVDLWLLTEEEPQSEKAARHWERNWEIVTQTVFEEDFDTMTKIQQGAASRQMHEFVYGRNEIGLQDYHNQITNALSAGRDTTVPLVSEVLAS